MPTTHSVSGGRVPKTKRRRTARRLAGETEADPSRSALAANVMLLQRTIGNRAVQGLFRDDPAKARLLAGRQLPERRRLLANIYAGASGHVQRKVAHTSGKQVDAYIDASPFIKKYVEAKVKAGTKAEGHVIIYNAADFDKAVVKYLMAHENPDTGKLFTKDEATARGANVNAYQGAGKIHVHEDRGEVSTTIHESMHLFEDDTATDLGFNVSEGMTEYFTRMLCKEQKITRTGFYESQLASVEKLVAATSKEKVAAAYFQGKVADLRSELDGKKAGGAGTFNKWVAFMGKSKYGDADGLL